MIIFLPVKTGVSICMLTKYIFLFVFKFFFFSISEAAATRKWTYIHQYQAIWADCFSIWWWWRSQLDWLHPEGFPVVAEARTECKYNFYLVMKETWHKFIELNILQNVACLLFLIYLAISPLRNFLDGSSFGSDVISNWENGDLFPFSAALNWVPILHNLSINQIPNVMMHPFVSSPFLLLGEGGGHVKECYKDERGNL